MSEQLQVLELPKELQQLAAANLGLAKEKADEHLAAFAPYMSELTELSLQMEAINFETPTNEDSKKASDLRKKLVKVRTGSEKEKDARKKSLLTEGNLIQSAFNLIKNACEMKEDSLAKVEKYQELLSAAELERITNTRMEQLAQYECNTDRALVGQMSDETFVQFLNGAKLGYEQKKEDERKAEEARLEAQRVAKLREERLTALRRVSNFLTDDESQKDFGTMSDDEWSQLVKVIGERKAEHAAKEAERQAEIERVRKEREEEEARFKKEREEADRKEREAKAEIARLEAEKRAKEEAEAKAKAEEVRKRIAEEKARKAAERKAANAPDAEKLRGFFVAMNSVGVPTLKGDEARLLLTEFSNDWASLLASYEEKINQL
jgi:hypothetical protein